MMGGKQMLHLCRIVRRILFLSYQKENPVENKSGVAVPRARSNLAITRHSTLNLTFQQENTPSTTMTRSTMMLCALAMLLVAPQCHSLALVALSVRATSLWGMFAPRPRQQAQRSATPVLYAHSQQMSDNDTAESTEEAPINSYDLGDDVAAYRSEMLNLVYERSMERLMQ